MTKFIQIQKCQWIVKVVFVAFFNFTCEVELFEVFDDNEIVIKMLSSNLNGDPGFPKHLETISRGGLKFDVASL